MTFFRDAPWRLPVVLAVALLGTALFQGSRGLYESTEGRYAECAREMVRAGSWLEPVLNGHPHWTKPPLTYLAIRVPCQVLGPTTWAARLYLIPCHLLAILGVWGLAFFLWQNRKSADLCAMVFATAGVPLAASQTVSTDYPLAAVLAVAQACFWGGYRQRSRKWMYGLWFAVGVAFLIKGPPALLVLPAMVVVWLRLPQAERRSVPLFAPAALALFLAVSLSWYVWEAAHHPGLLKYWLQDEVVNRSLSDKFNRHPYFYQNFVIYLPILLFGMLPWSGWLVFRWRQVWENVRVPGGLKGMVSGFSAEALWLVWAVALPLGVFALSRSKLPLYVLPLFAPFAVATGRLIERIYASAPWFSRAANATAALALVLFVGIKAGLAWFPTDRDMYDLHRTLVEGFGVRDPSRLAVWSDRPLNGLSYYYDYDIRLVSKTNLSELSDMKGEHFIVCRFNHGKKIADLFHGRAVCKEIDSEKWSLIHFSGRE